jgi:hypothetical protein
MLFFILRKKNARYHFNRVCVRLVAASIPFGVHLRDLGQEWRVFGL